MSLFFCAFSVSFTGFHQKLLPAFWFFFWFLFVKFLLMFDAVFDTIGVRGSGCPRHKLRPHASRIHIRSDKKPDGLLYKQNFKNGDVQYERNSDQTEPVQV
ncbi:MAG: hypothetical protein AB7C89_00650 [Intestinibacillus sp.]